jgi:hypothetical protein
MSILLDMLLAVASGLPASTYGSADELMCGDVGKAVRCSRGALTASGEVFKPYEVPSAAIAAPFRLRLSARWVYLKLQGPYPCRKVRLNDKMNPRWIGKRGLDLSPASVRLLTGRPATAYWSHVVEVCQH